MAQAPFGPVGPTSTDPTPQKNGIHDLFRRCLDAPSYNHLGRRVEVTHRGAKTPAGFDPRLTIHD